MTGADAPPEPPAGYDPISEETVAAPVLALRGRLVAWSDGFARLDAEITPAFINRSGYLHGGAHMILLDTVAGYSGCCCPYPGRMRRAVTVSLTTHFIGAASEGALVAEGRVVGGGRRLFFAEATLLGPDGSLLAAGSGSFRYVDNGGAAWGDPRPTGDAG